MSDLKSHGKSFKIDSNCNEKLVEDFKEMSCG